ncbi:hypothetical protein [Hyalangium rubrum]|uniref:Lipoprotein n=1 Tax=Hyalangium rubrum TaxID=3103134 RepID=A0ABU5H484_9BACT|nr:hypothetical protein [Hyalangium sp. s54d21]MDY7228293.1 hypothetical protein [Hyalangium sp. s54d21]
MTRFSLLALTLAATLGVACSKEAQENAPAQATSLKKASQAVGDTSLVEVPVSAEVLAAAGENATVRAFQFAPSAGELAFADVVPMAFEVGASDLSKPWERDSEHPERSMEDTQSALRFLDPLVPTIETQVGTSEAYRSGYYHWWQVSTDDFCHHADLHILVFPEARQVFTIEAAGGTEC